MERASFIFGVPSSAEATTTAMVSFRKFIMSSVTPACFLMIFTCMVVAGVVVTEVVVVVGVVVVSGVMVVVVMIAGVLEYDFQISQ